MFRERGIVIHAEDCVNDYWADRLTVEGLHLNVVGVHPAGGHDAHQTMEQAIRMLSTAEWAKFAGRMEKAGIAVEFEMHALSWMLEREKFAAHPHWFRTDENGNRTAQFNCCVSEPEALDYIRERACALSRIFVPDTNKYYFWIDDVASAGCQCEKCRALTPADQCMILTNAIAEGLEAGRPGAKQSYLAYCATLTPPKIVPRHNVFLEYAPIQRDHDRPLNDPGCTKNAGEIATLPALLDFFGKKDAKVLDYWMDNSLFSGWKRPPKEFHLREAVCRGDAAMYRELGFDSVTSFGCFLGQDYAELYGDTPLAVYDSILYAD
ncbi:MAG: DUF4838 domain-containing protein [Clostridia bacterium]|nr:DUF4838 domain-containing protein [Clostridia bacterium]